VEQEEEWGGGCPRVGLVDVDAMKTGSKQQETDTQREKSQQEDDSP
jgi:hypothetical protein